MVMQSTSDRLRSAEPGLPGQASAHERREQGLTRRIAIRIVPILWLASLMAYLDRVNVSFAALSMNRALSLSSSAFGLGVGIFFAGSFLFSVPANTAFEKVGGRRWLAFLMVIWGALSMSMAFVHNAIEFQFIRFLLGAAEAGFFPAMVLYLSYWLPQQARVRCFALSMTALPLSVVIGAPISGLVLRTATTGAFADWQWLFLIEGAPSVLLGVVAWTMLRDTPAVAEWLSREEREHILQSLAREDEARVENIAPDGGGAMPIRILQLSVTMFCLNGVNYGASFWLPQIVKELGVSNLRTGMLLVIPSAAGVAAMLAWSMLLAHRLRPQLGIALPILVAGTGLLGSTFATTPSPKIIWLTLATMGIFATLPMVWSAPTALLPRSKAGTGVAIISMSGLGAGFLVPFLVGFVKDATSSFLPGFWILSALGFLAAVVAATLPFPPQSRSAQRQGPRP